MSEMDRKGTPRGRVVNLRAISAKSGGEKTEGPSQELVGIALGYRLVYAGPAEVGTVGGILGDGSASRDGVGELRFVMIPGDMELTTAVIGFIASAATYNMSLSEDALWQ